MADERITVTRAVRLNMYGVMLAIGETPVTAFVGKVPLPKLGRLTSGVTAQVGDEEVDIQLLSRGLETGSKVVVYTAYEDID